MRHKCPSLVLYFLLPLLMGDLAMALRHYALDEGYTKTIPLKHPLPITASWDLRSIMNIDEAAGLMDLDLTLTLYWRDTGVSINGTTKKRITINPEQDDILKKIWFPDIAIDQAKSVKTAKVFLPSTAVRLDSDNWIRFSRRMRITFNCIMDFHNFPVDVQVCHVIFHSFSLSTSAYTLKFKKDAMKIGEDVQAAQFDFKVDYDDDFDLLLRDTLYPALKIKFFLKRRLTSHFMQEYFPSFLMTLTAYGSLFLPPVSINARGGMSLITLINIFKLNEGIRKVIPKVAYITFLDIWLMMCFVIIFFINFEFVGVLCLITIEKVKSAQRLEYWSKRLVPIVLGLFTVAYSIALIVLYSKEAPGEPAGEWT